MLKICFWKRRKKVNDDFVALCSASAFHLLNAGGLGNCHAEVVSEVMWLLDVTGDRGKGRPSSSKWLLHGNVGSLTQGHTQRQTSIRSLKR